MNGMMKLYIYLFFLVFYSSCQKASEECIPVENPDLMSCERIVCREIVSDDYLLSYPTAMFVIGGNLLIMDDKGHQTLFHVITKEGRMVHEFLKRGEGPEEYVSSTFNAQWSGEGILEMFDNAHQKVLAFDKVNGFFSFLSAFTSHEINGNIREMVRCKDGYLSMGSNGRFEDNRFLLLDTLGNVQSSLGNYPAISSDLLTHPVKDLQTMLFHTSFFRVSPDKQKAVFASYKGALIQFLDLTSLPDSIGERSLQLERPKKKEQISSDHEGWVYGFEDVYVSNQAVYAIYNGETALDNPGLGQYLLIYDWEANLRAKYRFDMGTRCLAVDESTNTVFVVGYVGDEMKLFTAQL